MRRTRLALGLAVLAAAAPVTWIHTSPPNPVVAPHAAIKPIPFQAQRFGSFELVGAWQIAGADSGFGGFSALITLADDRFVAGSDSGRKLVFRRPDRGSGLALLSHLGPRRKVEKANLDLESLTRDPATGTVWAGYEGKNRIVRFGPDLKVSGRVRPAAMRDWGANSGPEAFARLADGRFLVIEEGTGSWFSDKHQALVFSRDPVEDDKPLELSFVAPDGFRPVDLAPLDNGRALILFRKLEIGLPPGFGTAIGVVDIDRPSDDGILTSRVLARFAASIPQDNYEGMAVTDDPDGRHVWLISDDNFMHYQRTLLLKLSWDQRQKARE